MKAVHYDPNRYGAGEEGYWQQPGGREAPFVSGLPGHGGETNGGLDFGKVGFGPHLNVDAYPESRSPWGLLGASGGRWEFTETWGPGDRRIDRVRHGSQWFLFGHDDWDRLDQFGSSLPTSSTSGFRIVSIVPSPGGAGVFLVAVAFLSRRRRP